ncbi:MAG TPA: aminoacyl-tRNA hydrolase [Phycisphaerales bacterium]|nr:aminoacyl-tRNA hydrolase [Phycisphaerales bacterium]
MKLIVGLGNPGSQYTRTRHNAGFMVADRLCAKHGRGEPAKARFQAATTELSLGGEKVLVMKPTTFMNRSGQSISEAVRFFKVDAAKDLLVIVDDLYLPTGAVRLKPGGGAGGHNGLTSIQQLLGSDAYPRLRIGVGLQPSGGKPPFMDQADFVLGRFTSEEEPLLEGALSKAEQAVEVFAGKGLEAAMNFANAGPQRETQREKSPPKERPTDTT